jgi:hypothetical protein
LPAVVATPAPPGNRRELWRSFLYAAELLKPKAILIENVTDIATNEDASS